jgi:pSer/pThr/pTyr-binding forkhead associated (FHA) protein/WD40 repeat protein
MGQHVVPASVLGIALPSATLAVSVTGDGTVREWDADKGTAERRLALSDRRAVMLAVSPDARYVACVTDDGRSLLVYDGRTGNLLRGIGPAAAPVRALAAAPEGGLVVAAFDDHVLRCYDPRSGDLVRTVATGPALVHAVAIGDHGDEAVTACADGVLRRYHLGRGALIAEIGTPGPGQARAVTMTGTFAVAGGDDGTIWQWNLPEATIEPTLAAGPAGVRALAVTSGAELVLVLSDDGSIRLRQMSDGAVVADLTARLGAGPPVLPPRLGESPQLPPPPSTPPVLDEDVQFTVYRPASLPTDVWASMLVFIHKSDLVMDPVSGQMDPVEEVKERARAHFGHVRTHTSRADAQAPLVRGGQLHIVPELPGIKCVPAAVDVVWWQPIHQAEFQLYAGPELRGQVVRGWVRIWCGPLILGQLPIALPVPAGTESAATPPGLTAQPVVRYRRIFPSYSHRDAQMVEPFAVAARAIRDEYLQDVLALRAGDRWHERIIELIDSADVFQLFWSANSMRSEHCRREWEHALALRRPEFVCPLYWEDPLPRAPELGMPPAELSDLHFARIPVAASRADPQPGYQIVLDPEPAAHAVVSAAEPPAMSAPRTEAAAGQMAAIGPDTEGLPWLLVVSPETLRGRRVQVSRDQFTVGRAATNDLVLDDPLLSRVHAMLRRRGNELYVQDLGSTAGTTVNGIPVTGPQRLYPGDVVGLALVQLRYGEAGPAQGPQPSPVISNVGRDQYVSPPRYGSPQSQRYPSAPPARETRARTLVVPGIVLVVLGFAVLGAAAAPFDVIGLAAGLLGFVLLIAGLVRYAAARRRAGRER